MPSFAISQFTVLLEPLWVSAEFLLLSTGPLLYIMLLQLRVVLQLCACHPLTSKYDSNGTFRNVPLLLSHACPCAEWFDAYCTALNNRLIMGISTIRQTKQIAWDKLALAKCSNKFVIVYNQLSPKEDFFNPTT